MMRLEVFMTLTFLSQWKEDQTKLLTKYNGP